MMPFIVGVLAGLVIVCAVVAFVLVFASRPQTPKAEFLDCDWRGGMPLAEYDEISRRFDAAREDLQDYLLPTLRDPPPMPECKPVRDTDMWEVGAVDYRFINLTGEEK